MNTLTKQHKCVKVRRSLKVHLLEQHFGSPLSRERISLMKVLLHQTKDGLPSSKLKDQNVIWLKRHFPKIPEFLGLLLFLLIRLQYRRMYSQPQLQLLDLLKRLP